MKILNGSPLNPVQSSVVDHGLLTTGFSCVLQMATGSGKTWLASQAISDVLRSGARAIYLTPLRALAEELSVRWSGRHGAEVVGIFTGDYGKNGPAFPVAFQDARLLVMTPERLDACTRHWRSHWSWIPEVELVVIDEIHLLGDPGRGARLEGGISRFRRLNPFCRFLGLSATLGNRGELADWLEGVEFGSHWRPVPLRWTVRRYRRADEKPGLLATEVAETRNAGGQSLIFVQSRRRAESLAGYLREQGLHSSHHHAGLSHPERRETEEAFRRCELQALVATSTLEMGLNLPARKVVLYDLQHFDGSEFLPLSINSVWQRAGRAGRPGLDTDAEAVLLAPAWDRCAEHYSEGKFEPIRSGLREPAALAEQILVEVQTGLARSHTQIQRVFARSLAHRQNMALPVERVIDQMIEAGMLRADPIRTAEEGEQHAERLAATKLGRIACRHLLRPDTILRLKRFFTFAGKYTDFDLLVAVAATSDCEPVISVDYEELEEFNAQLSHRHSWIFAEGSAKASDWLQVDGKRLLSCFKAAHVALVWSECGDLGEAAAATNCYAFEVQRLAESLDRLLLAASAVREALEDDINPAFLEDEEPSPTTLLPIELLRNMVRNGLPREAARLTLIDGIGSKWAKRLVKAGYGTIEALAFASKRKLSTLKGLSEKRATKWIAAAKQLHRISKAPDVYAPALPIGYSPQNLALDPYRLRRSLDLTARQAVHNEWHVTGGLEPHTIRRRGETWSCDCQDSAKGFACKHQFAVRRTLCQPEILAALACVQGDTSMEKLDLYALWFQSRRPGR